MKITMIKSSNSCIQSQKDNLRSLGLKKIGDCVTIEQTPSNFGRLKAILHLVRVENSNDNIK